MSSRLKLAGICFAAAFALAACGGGGGSTAVNPDPPPMPTPPPAPTAESIKADAADAITAAIAAGMAAEQASKDAIKYAGMLTTRAVDGDSAMAAANAQMVLDAEMAANQAVMDADSALQDAMAAKTAAEALAEDDAERAGAIAAAEEAIKQATAQKKEAMGIVDLAEDADTAGIQSLKGAVVAVKGEFPLAEGYPKMPAGHGEDVATDVMDALANSVNPVVADATKGAIMHDGAAIGAMTWAQIVGDDNLVSQRISTGDRISGLTTVMATAFAGMEVGDTDVFATAPTNAPDTGDNADLGAELDQGASHNGIPGRVFCGGTDCSKNADGKLTGSWYFRPDSPTELYVPAKAGGYMIATMYARYGAWLTYADADTNSANGASRYAAVGSSGNTNTDNLDLGQEGPADARKDVMASYTGQAAGISVHNKTSGRFTADVNLTAKFAATPTLRGRISNFQGNAVGNWSVVLNETRLSAGSFDNGTTAGSGMPGAWTANAYGPTPVDSDGAGPGTDTVNQRPTGFFGTFDANFGDGRAVGGYATRKAE